MALAIDLSDHQAQALAEAAARLQVSEADLAAAAVRDLIAQPADDFDAAAQRVLSKNAELHRRLLAQSGGSPGLRDLGLLEASLALPRQSFAGADLYPDLIAKAAALGFSLIQNHPFVDGNKRIGHAALELTLVLNDLELTAGVDAAEAVVLAVASGAMDRETFQSRPTPARPDAHGPVVDGGSGHLSGPG